MVVSTERGFTIIEVMLFLGISGALFAALMIGVASSINQQRYRESVVSLDTLLQAQYAEAVDTRNDANIHDSTDGSNNFSCDDVNGVKQDNASTLARGTTNCVLLGKAIQIKKGDEITIYRVVGYEHDASHPVSSGGSSGSCAVTGTAQDINDVDTLRLYNPKTTKTFDPDIESLEWGSTLTTADNNHDPLTASFLILRSPKSGLLRVFTSPNAELPSNLCDMLPATNASGSSGSISSLKMCVRSDVPSNAVRQSLTINPYVSGPAGVSVNQADDICS